MPLAREIVPGLCSVTLRAETPETVLSVLADGGGRAVEWGADVHVPPGSEPLAERLGRQGRDAGIEVCSYGSYWKAGRSPVADIDPVLDTAEALGADHVRIWCSSKVPLDAPNRERSVVAEALATFARRAAARCLGVSVELHDRTLTETAASPPGLLTEAGAPNLATYWQPLLPMLDTAPDELRAVLDRCSHLHVQQFDAEGARRPLDQGAVDWRGLLALAASRPPAVVDRRAAFVEFVVDDARQGAVDAIRYLGELLAPG